MAETIATQWRTDPSGEPSASEIRESIAAERETITHTVDKIGDRLQQAFDWRVYVGEYPAIALGLAAGTGLLLSAAFARTPTPQERISDAFAELTEDLTDRVRGAVGDVITRPPRTLKTAATVFLAKMAVDFFTRTSGQPTIEQRVHRRDIPTRREVPGSRR
jgi:ElaB/YqjD/DUF883 family membrane-anchored ribosome-binding protein